MASERVIIRGTGGQDVSNLPKSVAPQSQVDKKKNPYENLSNVNSGSAINPSYASGSSGSSSSNNTT